MSGKKIFTEKNRKSLENNGFWYFVSLFLFGKNHLLSERDNFLVNFEKPKRPSIFKRILNKIPILRDRQDVITPFIGPLIGKTIL